VYDEYGAEGLHGGLGGERGPRGRSRYDHDFPDFFSFRDPEDVFREFFGADSPFAMFTSKYNPDLFFSYISLTLISINYSIIQCFTSHHHQRRLS
jgi:DnaJ-class molecular chaperone